MNNLFIEYPDFYQKLQLVKASIKEKLITSEDKFSTVVTAIFNENSKLIRPSLVLIGCEYDKTLKTKAINLAAAVEMMHVASLVHDDIIDEAKTRRQQPTINEQYDIGYAVICGDYLFSKAFEIIFATQDLKGVAKMGTNVTTMVFGEVEQYLDKYNEKLTIERYLAMIEKKTASFFAISLVLGAHLANASQNEIDLLEKIGLNLGIMFQIQDDLLDFKTSAETGKSSSMSDLKRGVYSLPIIITLEKSNSFKDYLKQPVLEYERILTYLDDNKAFEICTAYITDYYHKTTEFIEQLHNDNAKDKLTYLINKLIKRNEEFKMKR